MRRSDRDITDFDEIAAIMQKCDVCRIALNTGDYPYIVPLNFGMAVKDHTIELYFHGALEGTKYDLMRRDDRVCFEMDCGHKLMLEEDTGNCTMGYWSVIGRGRMVILPEEEKRDGLRILMAHYRAEDFAYNEAVVPRTNVFKLVVESVTGKARLCREKQ